jgi:hypothetical protein
MPEPEIVSRRTVIAAFRGVPGIEQRTWYGECLDKEADRRTQSRS